MKFITILFMVYEMIFNNNTKDNWNRISMGASVDVVMQNLTQTPTSVMVKTDGREIMAANQAHLKFIAQGYVDMWCVWQSAADSKSIVGIKIHAPIQVLEIGYKPTWWVCDSLDAHNQPIWKDQAPVNSQPFTFPEIQGPYAARATPVSTHSSLSITVRIQNK